MLELTLPSLPTIAELSDARFWALGGGLLAVCFRVFSWISGKNMTFGEVDRSGPPPEVPGLAAPDPPALSWPLMLRDAGLGAAAAAIFAVAVARDETDFESFAVVTAASALVVAFWALLHRPAGLVPVGEPPAEPDEEETGGVRKGTWRAVAFALAALAMALLQWGLS